MSNNIDSKGVTVSVKIYERILVACPAEFRREYGPAMKQLFRDQCRDAWNEAQGQGLAILWLRVLPDLAKTSIVEHLISLHRRESMCRKILRAFSAIRADARLRATFIKVFAVALVCVFGLSVCQMFWTPKVYSSTTRIEVQKDTTEIPGSNPYFTVTQFKIIESFSILTNVIATLHLDEKLAVQSGETHWTMDQTYAALFHRISVEQPRMTSLIEASVKNRDPKLAADIANAIVDAYRDARIEKWEHDNSYGIMALQTVLSDEETKLATMESNLKEMWAKLEMSDLDEESAAKISTVPQKYQSYFNLKEKIEGLRLNIKNLDRMIQREVAERGQRYWPAIIVRDPARPTLRPIQSMPEIFSIWMFGGTLVSFVVGGAGAWLTYIIRRASHRPSAPS